MRKVSGINNHRLRHSRTKYILLNTRLCRACWKCTTACPNGVIGKVDFLFHRHARIDHAEKCKGCSKCVKACPQGAITALGVRRQDN
ncbi:MAG: 4Fe-4S binding protein [Dehalococcoidia bacterium]|nr:4Fe-4S binding protein [Dehalococcoidia bacterium]